jgi:hypothetical protein
MPEEPESESSPNEQDSIQLPPIRKDAAGAAAGIIVGSVAGPIDKATPKTQGREIGG